MKLILTFLLILLVVVTPALAAAPAATVRLDASRHFAFLTFSNLKNVSRVNYTLIYDTSSTQKGLEGGFRTTTRSRSSTRRQILGTCSSGRCVYTLGVHNLQFDVTFTLRSGGTVNVTKTLP